MMRCIESIKGLKPLNTSLQYQERRVSPVYARQGRGRYSASGGKTQRASFSKDRHTFCVIQPIIVGLALALHSGLLLEKEAIAKTESGRTDFPEQISSAGEPPRQDLGKLIKGQKGKEIQDCSRKCIPTCLRGGEGAPGLGPMTVRKDLVVFKEGFRDRKYCLTECTTVCAISFLGPSAGK